MASDLNNLDDVLSSLTSRLNSLAETEIGPIAEELANDLKSAGGAQEMM